MSNLLSKYKVPAEGRHGLNVMTGPSSKWQIIWKKFMLCKNSTVYENKHL